MLTLKKEISRTTEEIDGDDVLSVKKELKNMGYYKEDEKVEMNKFTDEGLFKGISSFQKDNKLKVDEVMKPGGETEKKINEVRTSQKNPISQAVGAVYDFGKNVSELKWNNKDKKSDKYFHCNANCEATQRGKWGEKTAEVLSELKETFDQKFKRFPKEDSDMDHIANRYGRAQAKKYPSKNCGNLCKDVDKFFNK